MKNTSAKSTFCTQCGSPQTEGSRFCHNCGSELATRTTATALSASPLEDAKGLSKTPAIPVKETAEFFYAVPVSKFIIMNLATFGLYPLYWFGRNWNLVQQQEQSNISPFWRSVFSVFFYSELAKKTLSSARALGYDESYSPTVVAILYFIATCLWKLEDGWFLLGFSTILTLLPCVSAIQFANEKLNKKIDSRYGYGEITFLILGSLVWLCLVAVALEG